MVFPEQRILTSKKDRKWRVNCVDFIINEAIRERYEDIRRMIEAYKLINSQLDQEEYREICTNLGVSEDVGRKYVQAYNKSHNVYATLKGEEMNRPFTFTVLNLAQNAINETILKEELEFKRYMETVVRRETELFKKEIELDLKIKSKKIDPSRAEKELQVYQSELEQRYAEMLDIERLKSRLADKMTIKEQTITKLLKIAIHREKIPWIKNETFGDAIIAGREAVELRFVRKGEFPRIKQINVLNLYYHKSPDTPFTQDSDRVGYKEYMTLGQVLDEFGDRLHPKDLEKLQSLHFTGSGAYGTNDSLFMKRGDVPASMWNAKRGVNMYPAGADLDPYATMIIEGKYQAVPQGSGGSGGLVIGSGLYSNTTAWRKNYATVHTVYWRSYRKLYVYKYSTENGEEIEEIVSEDFVIPSDAKTETYKLSEFSGPRKRKYWYDSNGNYNCVEDIWLPEIWQGKRINGDIYLDIEPLEHAYQSLLNPYEAKLPVYGYVYNSRNAATVSVVDRLKPWQKLYYVVMSRLLKLITQDKGILTFLNTLMIDKDFGVVRTLQMAEDQGLIPFNPMAHSKGGTFVNNFKVAERVDATNSAAIQHYISLLSFIEQNLQEAVGMSPQRLAHYEPRQTATDNYRQTAHSMNITETLFASHEILWEQIMQGYMEMTISSLSGSTGKIKGFLNDEEVAILDLGLISLEDEYMLKVANSSRNLELLQKSQTMIQALIQNDKAKFSTLIELMDTQDINEFKAEIKKIESDISEKEERIEEARAKREHTALLREFLVREDEQKQRLDEAFLKGKLDIEKEHVRGRYLITSFNLKEDLNASGKSDIMEDNLKYQKFLAELAKTDAQLNIRERELEQRKMEHSDKLTNSEIERNARASEKEKDRNARANKSKSE